MTPAPPESLMDAERETTALPICCTCPFILCADGSKFYTSRNPSCQSHGDNTLDWRAFNEMTGKLDPCDVKRLYNQPDCDGRFGRIP